MQLVTGITVQRTCRTVCTVSGRGPDAWQALQDLTLNRCRGGLSFKLLISKVAGGLTGVQREEEHRPDGERDAHDDNYLWEPGLILVLRMHVVHQQVQRREYRQSGDHDRHHDQEPGEPRHRKIQKACF